MFQQTSLNYNESEGKGSHEKIRTIEAAVIAEQKNSFSAQVDHYTAYIKNNSAWVFAGIYADNALSGKNGLGE